MKINGTKRRLIEGTICGTTFSGHPTRTTFGNTLRVICYLYYVCKKTGVRWDPLTNLGNEINFLVAGDDVFALSTLTAAQAIRKDFLSFYSPRLLWDDDLEHEHGLGQCTDEFHISTERKIDFLSKDGFYHQGKFYIARGLVKAIFGTQLVTGHPTVPPRVHRRLSDEANYSYGVAILQDYSHIPLLRSIGAARAGVEPVLENMSDLWL